MKKPLTIKDGVKYINYADKTTNLKDIAKRFNFKLETYDPNNKGLSPTKSKTK